MTEPTCIPGQTTRAATNEAANGPKRSWHTPDIITVGGITDLTEGTNENVRDNHHDKPPTYYDTSRPLSGEVDLEGR